MELLISIPEQLPIVIPTELSETVQLVISTSEESAHSIPAPELLLTMELLIAADA